MKGITGVIANGKAEVEYILCDEEQYFMEEKMEAFSIYEIVDSGSQEKLDRFMATIRDDQTAINWEINVTLQGDTRLRYFSGLFWMEKFLIQISKQKVEQFFFPYQAAVPKNAPAFNEGEAGEISNEKLNEISRLNNELIDIQRELTKKNRQLERLNTRLEKLATTDSLTGIYNRRAVLNRAKTELHRAQREGRVFSLAILDLDNFKQINDSFGHQTGDKALMLFAEKLQKSTRKYDGAGRFGGDEFLVFFSLDEEDQFYDILERLQKQVSQISLEVSGDEIELTASIGGVSLIPGNETETILEELISQADEMLYQAKGNADQSICISHYE